MVAWSMMYIKMIVLRVFLPDLYIFLLNVRCLYQLKCIY